jgi:predicted AAA+ superfamily ATPase
MKSVVERYLHRHVEPLLLRLVDSFPAVVLTGARQTGKTTLLRHLFPPVDWHHVDLDQLDVRDAAHRHPEELLAGHSRVVIDEAQREPRILHAVKQAIDRDRTGFRAVLSGSSNLLLLQRVSESLAGRAAFLTLHPFTLAESRGLSAARVLDLLLDGVEPGRLKGFEKGVGGDAGELESDLRRGFLPPLLDLPGDLVPRWWASYVASYLEKDVLAGGRFAELGDFRRVLAASAYRLGRLVNMADIARDVGLSPNTVRRHMDLLEASHMLVRLPAYAVNRTRRLIKTPKIYFGDSGLAAHLSGRIEEDSGGDSSHEAGFFLEQLVLQQLREESGRLQRPADLFFWRTTNNVEVDFVVEQGRRLLAVEVKRTHRPRHSDADGLRIFLAEYGKRAVGGVLFHLGESVEPLGERIVALPIRAFLAGNAAEG